MHRQHPQAMRAPARRAQEEASEAASMETIPHMPRPTLVVVSGAPGTGKSTLAAELGARLGMPVLPRDAIKEALMDALGAPTRERSQELGRASHVVLQTVAAAILRGGASLVVESNFWRGTSEATLAPLATHARIVQVHCATAAHVVERRYRERWEAGLRHPGHFDAEALSDVLAGHARGLWAPLDLAGPLVRVDTTSGYAPALEQIIARVREG